MTRRSKRAWLGLVVLLAIPAAVPVFAAWRWEAATSALVGRLTTESPPASVVFTAEAVRQLPPPVGRYLQHVLREGQPRIVRAKATQEAQFFVNGGWKPLRATQQFATFPPGFLWDARIEMAPLVTAYVRDAYLDGEGSMSASLQGLYRLTDQKGRSELDAGALQRYLGEAIWFPTAFLPGAGIRWQPAGDRAAVATVADGEASASLEFRFDDRDEIVEVAGMRFAEQNGEYQLRPWHVQCRDYRRLSGVLVPVVCEVAWIMPEGPAPYWRGRIVELSYELAK